MWLFFNVIKTTKNGCRSCCNIGLGATSELSELARTGCGIACEYRESPQTELQSRPPCSKTMVQLVLSPPLNTYSGSNVRLTLMPRFTPLKARNESLPLSTSSEPVLTGLSAALIVQVVL